MLHIFMHIYEAKSKRCRQIPKHSGNRILYILLLGKLSKSEEESCHESERKGSLEWEIQWSRKGVMEVMTDMFVIIDVRQEGNGRSAFISNNNGNTKVQLYFFLSIINEIVLIKA